MPKTIEQIFEEMTAAAVLMQMHTKELVQGIRQLNKERVELKDRVGYLERKYEPPVAIDRPSVDIVKYGKLVDDYELMKRENESLKEGLAKKRAKRG